MYERMRDCTVGVAIYTPSCRPHSGLFQRELANCWLLVKSAPVGCKLMPRVFAKYQFLHITSRLNCVLYRHNELQIRFSAVFRIHTNSFIVCVVHWIIEKLITSTHTVWSTLLAVFKQYLISCVNGWVLTWGLCNINVKLKCKSTPRLQQLVTLKIQRII